MLILFPDLAMPVTVFSEQNNSVNVLSRFDILILEKRV